MDHDDRLILILFLTSVLVLFLSAYFPIN